MTVDDGAPLASTRSGSMASIKSNSTIQAVPAPIKPKLASSNSGGSGPSSGSSPLFAKRPTNRTPMHIKLDHKDTRLYDFEAQISPTQLSTVNRSEGPGNDYLSANTNVFNSPPREASQLSNDFGNYRKDLSVLETGPAPRVPSISHIPPTAASPQQQNIAPWMSSPNPLSQAQHTFGSFYDDTSDHGGFPSPGLRPGSDSDGPQQYNDERRPSLASIATTTSSGSRGSVVRANIHKKLQGFFGEEFTGRDSSDTSISTQTPIGKEQRSYSYSRHRERKASSAAEIRDVSPGPSRPKTPVPSSDVVPFLYQDSEDISKYWEAPVREDLAGPDRVRYVTSEPMAPTSAPSKTSKRDAASAKVHQVVHGHRHKGSDDVKAPRQPQQAKDDLGLGPPRSVPRERHGSAMAPGSSKDKGKRAASPNPSVWSQSTIGPATGSAATPVIQSSGTAKDSGKKGGILKIFRRHNKDSRDDAHHVSVFKSMPGSRASLDPTSDAKDSSSPDSSNIWSKDESYANPANQEMHMQQPIPHRPSTSRQGTFAKLPFTRKGRGSKQHDEGENLANSAERKQSEAAPNLFSLFDLSNMEGIVAQPGPVTPADDSIFTGQTDVESKLGQLEALSSGALGWNAPDSWAVKKVDDLNVSRLPEIDEAGIPPKADANSEPFFIRVFKGDGSFATLAINLNATVADVISQLVRKSPSADALDNYQIIMKKHDLQRILAAGERPAVIQKRLLEQAGFEAKDDIEGLGREDQSYLCRFLFIPQRDSGYAAISNDPAFNKFQKFSHVDFSGRNLITIPIALYSKASEIISLNLSRNLSLDLPKDFIQSCINLRDIKFTNNEAWKLPQSLNRAGKLTLLDVSNNRLEQLEHAELNRLEGLMRLTMSNNRLTHLPSYFQQFRQLRTLNVSSNFLQDFPEFLCELTTLVDLDMSFNAIPSLPNAIGMLTNLERIVITNNQLSGTLPETFADLSNLKEADIRYNALSNIDVLTSLPRIEQVLADHNAISVFEGYFAKIKILRLNSNPVTKFEITAPVPSLTTLVMSNAKLADIPHTSYEKMPNLVKLVLDKNHFVNLPPHIGKLRALEHFSIARNTLSMVPPEIGCLTELRLLDVSQNNLKELPGEIWYMNKLETLNISSNVLKKFQQMSNKAPQPPGDTAPPNQLTRTISFSPLGTPSLSKKSSFEELGPLEAFGQRRPSQASGGLLSVGSPPVSPPGGNRKDSMVSIYGKGGRNPSVVSRTASSNSQGTMTPPAVNRKDSAYSAKMLSTFAGSLKNLYLADNQLDDDVFDELTQLSELRILNLSYNELNELPQRTLKSWPQLVELYLSGNELTSLPADDFEDFSLLQTLHLNGNKFQTLPAELGKAHRLSVLDVGSNSLRYNVTNWPFDWNWNCNPNLRFLNLSGNKRLEIKPNAHYGHAVARDEKASPEFNSLRQLRVLGLMDVTLTIPTIPDETEDRRVRTSGSLAGSLAYGMADTLGRNEHLSIIDMIVPRFNSNDSETLMGMFDGQALPGGGSKVAKYLHANFGRMFSEQLKRLNPAVHDTPVDALRRTFLSLNKDVVTTSAQYVEDKSLMAHRGSNAATPLNQTDLNSGAVATVMFLEHMELYVANVGDAQAMLIQSEGGHRILTRKHDPAEPSERQRIRDAGGWVSRQGKLNDVLSVSRAFGYVNLIPVVQAAPHITQVTLKEQDEMIVIASSELWEYLSPDLIVDVARLERSDLVRAAQRLRDLAMAFGATNKIMVMIIGVSDLKRKERNRLTRGPSMSMGPTGVLDDIYLPSKRGKRTKETVEDSMLRRLEAEVQAPVGEISIVFTDIKGSTQLWENHQSAMRSAIKQHNEIMRRQLRIIGGYEVKTEGDAFMVSFPTATSALLWCFSVQSQLLDAAWPAEILNHPAGKEVYDGENNLIFRGLSVRMGIHFGTPVCENDPVTRRMDYFGPMVNKTSRISSTADGGQITVSADFISEIQRCLETFSETDRNGSTGSEDTYDNDMLSQAIRRELRSLSSQGFEVKPMGERKLKGLENPEYIYLMYPHALAGRISYQPLLGVDVAEAEANKEKEKEKADAAEAAEGAPEQVSDPEAEGDYSDSLIRTIDPQVVWSLWKSCLRLETLCEACGDGVMKPFEEDYTELINKLTKRGTRVGDEILVNFMRNFVLRTEACVTNLELRRVAAQGPGSGPIKDISKFIKPVSSAIQEVLDRHADMAEQLRKYKEKYGDM